MWQVQSGEKGLGLRALYVQKDSEPAGAVSKKIETDTAPLNLKLNTLNPQSLEP